ncbi:carbohydrate kinase [Bacillus sp. 31A1R]|uniref:Carbohydrate kinase n=1 Tax=Robertmurraya mangrovi TaxID=3098077 RepID=A0ABU5J286_9BACI|nr:carbohydrate kinase [Bacillus sp. 31A1R]MDZ5473523.1 carbohydrate kinase [Bacillus sp. 31A1R]
MSEKESLILNLIEEDPFISQNDLADKTGLSRSAVAGYVSSLTKQGKLLGRAYVIPKKKRVLCVGGANIDRKFQMLEELVNHTSNPVNSSASCGGVARNIAENLGRLDVDVSLMTVVGEDHEGKWLLEKTATFVEVDPSQKLPNQSTGTYTAVLDKDGELQVAFASMSIYDSINPDFVDEKWGYFASAELVMIDTNFPADVLEKIITRCEIENIPVCITTVSTPKVKRLPVSLKGVKWLIANQDEAEALAGYKISSEADLFKAAEIIMEKGVEKVIITRGDKGLIYYTKDLGSGVLIPPKVEVVDVTGAGDSLVAGIMYASLKGVNIENACKVGMTCSILTLQSKETVNSNLSPSKIEETNSQYF